MRLHRNGERLFLIKFPARTFLDMLNRVNLDFGKFHWEIYIFFKFFNLWISPRPSDFCFVVISSILVSIQSFRVNLNMAF